MISDRLALAFVNARLRVANSLAWKHRTKVLGGIGMGTSYVLSHQDQLSLFVSAHGVAIILGFFGGAAFCIGLFNTYFPDAPRP